MNSVEPTATSPAERDSTRPVFPFSVQGVIRANSVSPFANREPPPPTDLTRQGRTRRASAGNAAMSRNGARTPRATGRRGFTSTASENAILGHESFIRQLRRVTDSWSLRRGVLGAPPSRSGSALRSLRSEPGRSAGPATRAPCRRSSRRPACVRRRRRRWRAGRRRRFVHVMVGVTGRRPGPDLPRRGTSAVQRTARPLGAIPGRTDAGSRRVDRPGTGQSVHALRESRARGGRQTGGSGGCRAARPGSAPKVSRDVSASGVAIGGLLPSCRCRRRTFGPVAGSDTTRRCRLLAGRMDSEALVKPARRWTEAGGVVGRAGRGRTVRSYRSGVGYDFHTDARSASGTPRRGVRPARGECHMAGILHASASRAGSEATARGARRGAATEMRVWGA